MNLLEITSKVQKSIETIRPFLVKDGGDISLESVSEDMVVTVRLHGACEECPLSAMTMKNGVEEAILRDVPEIKTVIALE